MRFARIISFFVFIKFIYFLFVWGYEHDQDSFNLKVCFNQFKLSDNNINLINKIIKFFLYYILIIQFSILKLENSILKI